jgi:hypothetical protein
MSTSLDKKCKSSDKMLVKRKDIAFRGINKQNTCLRCSHYKKVFSRRQSVLHKVKRCQQKLIE